MEVNIRNKKPKILKVLKKNNLKVTITEVVQCQVVMIIVKAVIACVKKELKSSVEVIIMNNLEKTKKKIRDLKVKNEWNYNQI